MPRPAADSCADVMEHLKMTDDAAPDSTMSPRWASVAARSALVAIVVAVLVLADAYHRRGHPQGDDFALYLRQARSIFEGNIAQVVADNRFTAVFSGPGPFTPYAYPWGFPLLLAPFVNRWGLDYDRLKWVVVACLAAWVVVAHGAVRRRIGRPAALGVAALVATAPAMLKHTDSLLSEFPAALSVGLVVYAFDRIHLRGSTLLTAGATQLVGLGALSALAFNMRREAIVLFVAVGIVQAGELLAAGHWRDLRSAAHRRSTLWMLAMPHAGFFGTAALAQFLLPSMLFPENGGGISYVDDRLGDYLEVLTDQLGLDKHPRLGLSLLVIAAVGMVLGIRRRPRLDGFLAAVTVLTLLAISTHFRMVGRYYLQLMPWLAYFVVVAVSEVMRAVVGAVRRGAPPGRGWRVALAVVPVLPVLWVVGVHLKVVPEQIGRIADDDAAGFVHVGPANPWVTPIYDAVDKYAEPNDVVVFFRARTMTLMTDRRAIQTGDLERTIAYGDWLAQLRDSDFYQVDLDRPTLESLGFQLVWSDARWYLWRVP
ncbi:MAG: hypothetical protein ACKOYG_08790 [Ilumatobacteraceae bacterium]